ncbi:hypothetical protein [Neobacillus terrae]|uniref:hypothetical protein n=1 Tax=Neobacillus terrae TaxID=3034837 RepID=UPI00140B1F50|nr:hypothetical protein [Neobacillus terrae]NHM32235.1 hypothetical protein [Neobacillus terrae]
MRNFWFWFLLVLIAATILSFILGFHKAGYALGFLLSSVLVTIGTVYAAKNNSYTHKSYHEDYINRRKR